MEKWESGIWGLKTGKWDGIWGYLPVFPSTSRFFQTSVGTAPGGIFVTFSRYSYVELRMYILCRLVPETSYWPAFKILLSTSDFKHGDHCT
jgi:hypothetical protein